jgi:hypothetical protein
MLEKLKANWLNAVLMLVALLGGADAAVGVRSGKSPMNVTVIPSLLAAIGAGGTVAARWLNNRQVVSRSVRQGLPHELSDRIENLFGLARDPDVTPDHATHLADMAGEMILAEHRRARAEYLEKTRPIKVVEYPKPPNIPPEVLEFMRFQWERARASAPNVSSVSSQIVSVPQDPAPQPQAATPSAPAVARPATATPVASESKA